VFGDRDHRRGNIAYLTTHHTHRCRRIQPAAAATATPGQVINDRVRAIHQFQRKPLCPRLFPWFTTRLTAQRPQWWRMFRAVRGRWLRRVPRILSQPALQLGVLRPQHRVFGTQRRVLGLQLGDPGFQLLQTREQPIQRHALGNRHTKIIPCQSSTPETDLNDLNSHQYPCWDAPCRGENRCVAACDVEVTWCFSVRPVNSLTLGAVGRGAALPLRARESASVLSPLAPQVARLDVGESDVG
jgi:hypothetical protein